MCVVFMYSPSGNQPKRQTTKNIMKTEYKTKPCAVSISAGRSRNVMCLHRYDENDKPLNVIRIEYLSGEDPATECFAAIENAAEEHGYTLEIEEQDGNWYHGVITE